MATATTKRIACLLLAVALISGCASSRGIEFPRQQAKENPAVSSAINFESLSMVSEVSGWAIAAEGVFHTDDGGRTWSNATPAELDPATAGRGTGFFVDNATAWFLAPTQANEGSLFKTENGGKRWSRISDRFPAGSPWHFAQVQGHQYGWALRLGRFSGNEPVEVYATTDGQSWNLVHQGGPKQEGPGVLPYGGEKTGLAFRPDVGAGWMTIQYRTAGQYGLYRSEDKGKSWWPQRLPIPGDLQSEIMYITAPRFFDAQSGVLPVQFWKPNDESSLIMFTTHDGGETWVASPPLRAQERPTNVAAVDATHWWVANSTKVLATEDGGRTWAKMDVPKGLKQLQFMTPQTGWALVDGGLLLQTSDGGKTWSQIYPGRD